MFLRAQSEGLAWEYLGPSASISAVKFFGWCLVCRLQTSEICICSSNYTYASNNDIALTRAPCQSRNGCPQTRHQPQRNDPAAPFSSSGCRETHWSRKRFAVPTAPLNDPT